MIVHCVIIPTFLIVTVAVDEVLEGCVEGFAVGTLSASATCRQGNTVDEVFHCSDVHRDRQRKSLRVAVPRSHRLPVKRDDADLHGQRYLEITLIYSTIATA